MQKNLLYISLLLLCLFGGCSHQSPSQKPNVVLILADDLGYGDLGCYGCEDILTPNIDYLAKQGVKLTNFYANGPECTPTRTALITGRYQQRAGGLECAIGTGNVGRYDESIWLAEKKELGIPYESNVLPVSLKNEGYNTAIIGKWHLGYEEKFRPNNHGFDYSIGPIGYGGDYFYHMEQFSINLTDFTGAHNLAQNGKEIFREGEYMTELITREAVNWLKDLNKDGPFFLYLPFTAPHSPFQGPDDDLGRPIEGKEWTHRNREKFTELVEAMDMGIGEVLTTLKELNLEEETLVIFFSDNGGARVANNGIFSGYKGQVYEGGIHVPCIIKWPGHIQPNTVSDQVTATFDLSCSILKLAGTNTDTLKLDGYDIINHISDGIKDIERALYWRLKRAGRVSKAVREGNYKYMIEIDNDTIRYEKLFNLKEDPSELNDLIKQQPGKTDSLKKILGSWEEEVKSPRLTSFPGL